MSYLFEEILFLPLSIAFVFVVTNIQTNSKQTVRQIHETLLFMNMIDSLFIMTGHVSVKKILLVVIKNNCLTVWYRTVPVSVKEIDCFSRNIRYCTVQYGTFFYRSDFCSAQMIVQKKIYFRLNEAK